MEADDNDYAWQPPSEAEMKIIRARRERDNKISQRMGDYLLKGYKMLGTVCNCGTILLQDKQGKNYCIACNELDSDVDKDDPVRNQAAALAQVREQELSSQRSESAQPPPAAAPQSAGQVPSRTDPPSTNSHPSHNGHPGGLPTVQQSLASQDRVCNNSAPDLASLSPQLKESIDILTRKISWATDELQRTSSVEYSIQLCQLIKHSADAIQSLKYAG